MNRPLCPDCGAVLKEVKQERGYLNRDQFDSIKAGDWYCDSMALHPDDKHRGDTDCAYYWASEVYIHNRRKEIK